MVDVTVSPGQPSRLPNVTKAPVEIRNALSSWKYLEYLTIRLGIGLHNT